MLVFFRYASGGGLILCRFRKASSIKTARLSGRVSIQSKSHCGSATAIGIFFKRGAAGFRPAPSRLPPTVIGNTPARCQSRLHARRGAGRPCGVVRGPAR